MTPKLVAVAGLLKGQEFRLGSSLTIGRDASNGLAIADPLLSQRHCTIESDGDGFRIKDSGSLNGTFVNGTRVEESRLEQGDRIKAGGTHLILLAHDDDSSARIEIEEVDLTGQETIQVQYGETRYQQSDRPPSELAPIARVASDLDTLLRVGSSINSVRNPEALQRVLLELVFESIPAESGAILLVGQGTDDFVSRVLKEKKSDEDPFRYSRTLVDQVLRDGVAVLSNTIGDADAVDSSESLIASRATSVLCVPLIDFGRKLGVIYLVSTHAATRFDEDHLHLLTGIAGVAAVALEHARHVDWLESENQRLRDEIGIDHDMIGDAERMHEVYEFIRKVAPSDATVLICGESGTGKELVARAVHSNSDRADKPFVAINCGALVEGVVESELFGHEPGAFTDARKLKKGKIEVADGGTLFLDEIGELSPKVQTRLLRVLQEREFERVGGTRPIGVDVRIVAATNRDLEEGIKSGTFRQDLYFRVNVVTQRLPALREHREDIPALARHFVSKHGRKSGAEVPRISVEAEQLLSRYDWPGNIRELENAIERAVVMRQGEWILPEDLPEAVIEQSVGLDAEANGYHEQIVTLKRELIINAVRKATGNITAAAEALGLHPNYLHRLIRNLDLRSEIKKNQ